jgi:hypothetical protein
MRIDQPTPRATWPYQLACFLAQPPSWKQFEQLLAQSRLNLVIDFCMAAPTAGAARSDELGSESATRCFGGGCDMRQ